MTDKFSYSIKPRKWLTFIERIDAEAGVAATYRVKRVVAVAIFENVLAAGKNDDDLKLLIDASEQIGTELVTIATGQLERPAIAYGKAAIVGVDGDIEHAAAVLHPKLGAPMRAAIGGGKALIPSTSKVASAGASIDIPIGHKDDPWSFDMIDTVTIVVPDAPRPAEILLAVAFSDGGRARPRLPK